MFGRTSLVLATLALLITVSAQQYMLDAGTAYTDWNNDLQFTVLPGTGTIDLPFNFSYFGIPRKRVLLTRQGGVFFNVSSACADAGDHCLPPTLEHYPTNAILPLFRIKATSIEQDVFGTIRYATPKHASGETAFVAQWTSSATSPFTITFSVILIPPSLVIVVYDRAPLAFAGFVAGLFGPRGTTTFLSGSVRDMCASLYPAGDLNVLCSLGNFFPFPFSAIDSGSLLYACAAGSLVCVSGDSCNSETQQGNPLLTLVSHKGTSIPRVSPVPSADQSTLASYQTNPIPTTCPGGIKVARNSSLAITLSGDNGCFGYLSSSSPSTSSQGIPPNSSSLTIAHTLFPRLVGNNLESTHLPPPRLECAFASSASALSTSTTRVNATYNYALSALTCPIPLTLPISTQVLGLRVSPYSSSLASSFSSFFLSSRNISYLPPNPSDLPIPISLAPPLTPAIATNLIIDPVPAISTSPNLASLCTLCSVARWDLSPDRFAWPVAAAGALPKDVCLMDCTGRLGGTAVIDSCGVCSGGTTGKPINGDLDSCNRCFGGASSGACPSLERKITFDPVTNFTTVSVTAITYKPMDIYESLRPLSYFKIVITGVAGLGLLLILIAAAKGVTT